MARLITTKRVRQRSEFLGSTIKLWNPTVRTEFLTIRSRPSFKCICLCIVEWYAVRNEKRNGHGVNLSDDGYNPVNVPQSSWDIVRKFRKGYFQLTYKSRFSFWDVTLPRLVVRYRRSGTTCRPHLLRTAWHFSSQAIAAEAWNQDFRIDLERIPVGTSQDLPACLSVCLPL